MCILVGARRRPAGSGEYFGALPACGRGHVHSARGSIVRVGPLHCQATVRGPGTSEGRSRRPKPAQTRVSLEAIFRGGRIRPLVWSRRWHCLLPLVYQIAGAHCQLPAGSGEDHTGTGGLRPAALCLARTAGPLQTRWQPFALVGRRVFPVSPRMPICELPRAGVGRPPRGRRSSFVHPRVLDLAIPALRGRNSSPWCVLVHACWAP